MLFEHVFPTQLYFLHYFSSITESISSNYANFVAGECIIRVWNHGPAVQPCKCPICRRLINLLVPANVSIDNDDDPQIQHVLGEVQHYNRIFGGTPRNLTQVYTLFTKAYLFCLQIWKFECT